MHPGFLSGICLCIGFSFLIKSITSIWFQKIVATHLCHEMAAQSQRGRKMIRQCFKLHAGLLNYYWYKEKHVSFVTKITTFSRKVLYALSWALKKKSTSENKATVTIIPANTCQNLGCKHGFEFCNMRLFPVLKIIFFRDCFKFSSSSSVVWFGILLIWNLFSKTFLALVATFAEAFGREQRTFT